MESMEGKNEFIDEINDVSIEFTEKVVVEKSLEGEKYEEGRSYTQEKRAEAGDQGKITSEIARRMITTALRAKDDLERDRIIRARFLIIRKGKEWRQGITLKNWIEKKAEEWGRKIGEVKISRMENEAKKVEFETTNAKEEFWMRRIVIRKEARFEVEEDLSERERIQKQNMISRAAKFEREEKKRCWAENRYMVALVGKERKFYKWNMLADMFEVGEPEEEVRKREWEKTASEEEW